MGYHVKRFACGFLAGLNRIETMASLTQVAKRAGVSIATASIVLNPGKQENRVSAGCADRVREAARALGYVPNYHARSMKLGRAEVVAVTLDIGHYGPLPPAVSELGSTYFGTLLGSVELQLRNADYATTIVGPDRNMRAHDRGLLGIRQRRFDGMVVTGVVIQPEFRQMLTESPKAPIVVVEYRHETKLPVVDWDEAAGARLAVEHLAELGHKRLLYVTPGNRRDNSNGRGKLVAQEARRLGLHIEEFHFPEAPNRYNAVAEADACEPAFIDYLRTRPRDYTGVICYNDRTALGVCGACHALGVKIPDELSVVGFDNIEAALSIPRVTSVNHELAEMGKRAVELVLQMIKNKNAIKDLRGHRDILQPALVVRKSTAPPPKQP